MATKYLRSWLLAPGRSFPRACDRRRNSRSRLHLVLSGDNNPLAGRETLFDLRAAVDRFTDGDLAHLGLIVRIHDECVEAVYSMLNRIVGNDAGILQGGYQEARRNRLAWPQRVILVVAEGLEAVGAADGIDLIVHHRQAAFRQG